MEEIYTTDMQIDSEGNIILQIEGQRLIINEEMLNILWAEKERRIAIKILETDERIKYDAELQAALPQLCEYYMSEKELQVMQAQNTIVRFVILDYEYDTQAMGDPEEMIIEDF